jgi:hypothetical protein
MADLPHRTMSRLSELLLVEAVRDYSSTLGGQEAVG